MVGSGEGPDKLARGEKDSAILSTEKTGFKKGRERKKRGIVAHNRGTLFLGKGYHIETTKRQTSPKKGSQGEGGGAQIS